MIIQDWFVFRISTYNNQMYVVMQKSNRYRETTDDYKTENLLYKVVALWKCILNIISFLLSF